MDMNSYCARHHSELNALICHECNTLIGGSYLETELKQKFHPHCFSCQAVPAKYDSAEDWAVMFKFCLRTSTYAGAGIHPHQVAFQQTSMQRLAPAGYQCDSLKQLWDSIPMNGNYFAILGMPATPERPAESRKYNAVGFIRDHSQAAWHLLMYDGFAKETVDPVRPLKRQMANLQIALAQMVTLPHYMDERPILSIRFGHANMTPATIGQERFRYSPLYLTGIHQSLMWIDSAAREDTPRALEGDARFQGLQPIDFATFRRNKRMWWEYPLEVLMARENIPRSQVSFPSEEARKEQVERGFSLQTAEVAFRQQHEGGCQEDTLGGFSQAEDPHGQPWYHFLSAPHSEVSSSERDS